MTIKADLINNSLPTTKQLQCFLAVAQELNFRKAAERLNMTQPPLTRQIRCLEELLGCSLFSRNTHAVVLTSTGQKLQTQAEYILLALTKLSSTCIENTSRLRIGTTNALNFGNIRHLGGAIERLKGADITDLQNLNSGQLSQSLQKGLLDIVIIGEKSVHTGENIAFHWLYKEPLKLVMPASHPAAKRSRVSLTEVCKLPLFWFSRAANPNLYDKCENLFDKLPCTFKRIKEPDDSMTMLSYISKGKAIALMPYSMCTFEHKDLVYKQLNDQQSRHLNIDVYAATRKSDTRPMVLEAIQQLQLP